MITDVANRSALMFVNVPAVNSVYIYRISPKTNIAKLTGRKILIGEYRVHILIIIMKNRTPS
jgi:hypothetical protein